MSYQILLADGVVVLLQITAATFKNREVWNIQFIDGREVMLCKCGKEWLQRNEDQLDYSVVVSIGKYIDGIGSK